MRAEDFKCEVQQIKSQMQQIKKEKEEMISWNRELERRDRLSQSAFAEVRRLQD